MLSTFYKNHLKKFFRKNTIIVLSAIILSLISISSFFVIQYGNTNKKINITLQEHNKVLQISEIKSGGSKYNLKDFENEYFKYNEEYQFLYTNTNKGNLEIITSSINDVKITFIKNTENGTIEVEELNHKNQTKKIINSTSDEITYEEYTSYITIKEILYNTISCLDFKEIVVNTIIIIVLTILYSIVINKIIKYLKLMNDRYLNIKESIAFVCCIFILMINNIYIILEILNIYIIIPITILLILILKININIHKRIANIFIIFATIMGISILFIHPPYNVPDERSHFYKAYEILNNVKIKDEKTANAYINIPKSITNSMHPYTMSLHEIDYKLSAKTILADFNNKFNDSLEQTQVWYGNVTSLPKLCYIPAALMIKLCTIINAPIILSCILSRFINLLLFIVIVNKAIQITPKYKKSIMIIGLLPITLSQAAAINQDSITNTIFLFICSYIFYLADDSNKITIKKLIPIYTSSLLLGFCKSVYFPILFLLFLVPNKNFKSMKNKMFHIISIILINLIVTFANIYILKVSNDVLGMNYYTISTIFSHPIQTIRILINTILERLQLDMLGGVVNGFGWSTKWGKNLFTFIIQTIFLLMYLTANTDECSKKRSPLRERLIVFIAGLIIIGLIYYSFLTGYTIVGSDIICGLQSRYFILPILLFVISISNNLINIKIKNQNKMYLIFFSISYVITMYTLIYGFYI